MKRNYENPAAERCWREICADPARYPVSFSYGGKSFTGFAPDLFKKISDTTEKNDGKETETVTFLYDGTLTVTVITSFYREHGVSEWTVWFENRTDRDTDVISGISSSLEFPGEKPVLRGILGDHVNSYATYVRDLTEEPVRFVSDSGRPTHINFPYFNLEYGDRGVILVIGWAGTWTADFAFDGEKTRCTARSTNNLRTVLKPGEKIRSALFVCAPYTVRDEHYSVNFWRSWFIRSNLPPLDRTEPLHPLSTFFLAYDTGIPNSDGSISERYFTWRPSFDKAIAEGVNADVRWFDAGWYEAPDGHSPFADWFGTVGTWKLDGHKWPGKTFRQSTDFAREHGMRTMVWFEPERVTDPDSLVRRHGYKKEWAIDRGNPGAISNNIGDPDCLRWTTDRICSMLRENGVEIYREDNNIDPGPLWQYLDEQEEEKEGSPRSGITECKIVINHYKMWDDIIDCTLSFGGCGFVDSCASGGGRNDLESLRRGVPVLRSDSDRTTTAIRLSMTTAFNKWIPYCGANTREKTNEIGVSGNTDRYIWRASYLPILNIDSQYVYSPDQNFDMLRFGLNEWKGLNRYLTKEFYVLTPWHTRTDRTGFTAYSFFDPDDETGILLAFRMEDCAEEELTVALPYIPEGETWELTDADSGEVIPVTSSGTTLKFAAPRTDRLFTVKKK